MECIESTVNGQVKQTIGDLDKLLTLDEASSYFQTELAGPKSGCEPAVQSYLGLLSSTNGTFGLKQPLIFSNSELTLEYPWKRQAAFPNVNDIMMCLQVL